MIVASSFCESMGRDILTFSSSINESTLCCWTNTVSALVTQPLSDEHHGVKTEYLHARQSARETLATLATLVRITSAFELLHVNYLNIKYPKEDPRSSSITRCAFPASVTFDENTPVVHVWDGEMKSSKSPRRTLPENWLIVDLSKEWNEEMEGKSRICEAETSLLHREREKRWFFNRGGRRRCVSLCISVSKRCS